MKTREQIYREALDLIASDAPNHPSLPSHLRQIARDAIAEVDRQMDSVMRPGRRGDPLRK